MFRSFFSCRFKMFKIRSHPFFLQFSSPFSKICRAKSHFNTIAYDFFFLFHLYYNKTKTLRLKVVKSFELLVPTFGKNFSLALYLSTRRRFIILIIFNIIFTLLHILVRLKINAVICCGVINQGIFTLFKILLSI